MCVRTTASFRPSTLDQTPLVREVMLGASRTDENRTTVAGSDNEPVLVVRLLSRATTIAATHQHAVRHVVLKLDVGVGKVLRDAIDNTRFGFGIVGGPTTGTELFILGNEEVTGRGETANGLTPSKVCSFALAPILGDCRSVKRPMWAKRAVWLGLPSTDFGLQSGPPRGPEPREIRAAGSPAERLIPWWG